MLLLSEIISPFPDSNNSQLLQKSNYLGQNNCLYWDYSKENVSGTEEKGEEYS